MSGKLKLESLLKQQQQLPAALEASSSSPVPTALGNQRCSWSMFVQQKESPRAQTQNPPEDFFLTATDCTTEFTESLEHPRVWLGPTSIGAVLNYYLYSDSRT